MNKLGICSITFRQLTPSEVIEVVKKAGLDAIEWGSDVHVKPGNIENAKSVGDLTLKNGLEVSSYGSYYRVGGDNEFSFEDVLETAISLGTKNIRVWAGDKGSDEVDEQYRENVVEDGIRIAKLAYEKGVNIHYEYHGNTLTDTAESAKSLIEGINQNNVYIYWQPALFTDITDRLKDIEILQSWISNVHVFQWNSTAGFDPWWKGIERLGLSEGVDEWQDYISILSKLPNRTGNRFFLLEFTKDDTVEQFYKDAKILKKMIKE